MKVAILGCGFMGASLATALRGGGFASSITGYDLDPQVTARGMQLDVLDVAAESPAQAARGMDLVVLASPVGSMPALLADIADALGPTTVVTDLGSTKANVVDAARRALGPAFARFVPAHPIAGGEHSGLESAEPNLFEGRTVVITPESETRADAVERVEQLWRSCGANIVKMYAGRHDRLLASVSHLPHVLAFAVVAQIADQPDAQDKLSIAGPGFRDFTRIAASSAALWQDIAMVNRDAIAQELRGLITLLQQTERALAEGDRETLQRMFELASRTRNRMNLPMTVADEFAGGTVLNVSPIKRARGRVRLPGSKSISNRALLLAALSPGTTELTGLLEADDTRVMIEALRALGVAVEATADRTVVCGCGGRFPQKQADLFLGNAGTAMRPLAAALAFSGGNYRLDGVARMRERPIGDLVEALNALGARIRYEGQPGFPPLRIEPAEAAATDRVAIRGSVSSQFVSGLLMAAPLIAPPGGLDIELDGPLISEPYVQMTLALMARFGVQVRRDGSHFRVMPSAYRSPGQLAVEGDASSASYFLALGALAGGPVRVEGVGADSIQGDVAFARLLQDMGAQVDFGLDWIEARQAPLVALTADCTAIPDSAMTAAIVALFARGTTRLNGIASWRVKETDRMAAVCAELRKLGAQVRSGDDWIEVDGPCPLREAWIDTYDDHRIAMCFALAAAGGVPVHVRDPDCVGKTFPTYFNELAQLCFPSRLTGVRGQAR